MKQTDGLRLLLRLCGVFNIRRTLRRGHTQRKHAGRSVNARISAVQPSVCFHSSQNASRGVSECVPKVNRISPPHHPPLVQTVFAPTNLAWKNFFKRVGLSKEQVWSSSTHSLNIRNSLGMKRVETVSQTLIVRGLEQAILF